MSKTKDAPDLATSVDITFPEPIVIDGNEVADFQLVREPTGNDLGRHTFTDLLDGSIRALAFVTPKIIQPYLSPKIIKDMGARNSMALQMAYNAFFERVDMDGMAKPSETLKKSPSTPSAQKVA